MSFSKFVRFIAQRDFFVLLRAFYANFTLKEYFWIAFVRMPFAVLMDGRGSRVVFRLKG